MHELEEVQPPRCPACSHAPLRFGHNVIENAGGAMISIVWCGDCGHTIGTQYLGQNQQSGPRLIIPN